MRMIVNREAMTIILLPTLICLGSFDESNEKSRKKFVSNTLSFSRDTIYTGTGV